MASDLEVVEGTKYQSADEELSYTITTTNWGSTPSSVSAVAFDELDDSNVTTTVFPTNTPSVTGDVITLSPLKSLTLGHRYRIEVKFTSGTNKWECRFFVECIM